MALAEAFAPLSSKETEDCQGRGGGGGARDELRAMATDGSSTGARPGILAELGPQQSVRAVRRSAGEAFPTLGLPVLAEASGEAVDAATLAFLSRKAKAEKMQEDWKARQAKKTGGAAAGGA